MMPNTDNPTLATILESVHRPITFRMSVEEAQILHSGLLCLELMNQKHPNPQNLTSVEALIDRFRAAMFRAATQYGERS